MVLSRHKNLCSELKNDYTLKAKYVVKIKDDDDGFLRYYVYCAYRHQRLKRHSKEKRLCYSAAIIKRFNQGKTKWKMDLGCSVVFVH